MNIKPPKTWNNENHFLEVITSDWYKLIVDMENEISFATYDFYKDRKIGTLFLPITTGSISSPMGLGSDSKPVKINMFGVDTYLADSMQFMLEYGCRLNNNGAFYIMPSFRGEMADSRHLCQFYHSEVEIPGTITDIMSLAEDYIKYLANRLLTKFNQRIEMVAGETKHIEKICALNSFPRISYFEAINILKKRCEDCVDNSNGFQIINAKGEKELIRLFDGIVWLTNIDKLIVPFYQAVDKTDERTAKCADLLFGIGEVVGSGERHSTGDEVVKSLELHKVNKNDYNWYIKMKECNPLKTSGFGMGIERFLLWVLKHDDIRDCQLLFRQNGKNIIP